jgi:spore germination protein YaaH
MKHWKYIIAIALIFALSLQGAGTSAHADSHDRTSKYRVYQNDRILKEYSDVNQAVKYAKSLMNSHVEVIGSRRWVWDNFPRYRVYQKDNSLPQWQFASLEDAVIEAGKWRNSSVRDLHADGWIWDNYSRSKYKLYQGEKTFPHWEFEQLDAALKEAKNWANSHIVQLSGNEWIWDNYSQMRMDELRAGAPVYRIFIDGFTEEEWVHSFLGDAVKQASQWPNAVVVNLMKNNTIVYANKQNYKVYQNKRFLKGFYHLDEALQYAKKWAHAAVTKDDREIWNNYPYYQVLQNGRQIGEYPTIHDSLSFAMKYANASIQTYHGAKVWDNMRKLQYWAWNGSATPDRIKQFVSQTQGLDVNSPTWFALTDGSGAIEDTSDKEIVAWLKNQSIAVHPLVHNQFNAKLTSQFLSNPAAQQQFIERLVKRLVELGADGVNVDFENVSGKDRDAFTVFMRNLTDYAHRHKLIVSVDLPRGSVRWNHLTAFDHAKLAHIVDYVMIMTYDQHYAGSPAPGSVAGMQWVEEGVKDFLSYGIARDKLIMGIPFYVREWKIDQAGKTLGNRALYMRTIAELIRTEQVTSTWDANFQQYKVEYLKDGVKHVFWLEDENTVKARLAFAKNYDLAGTAAWRLGHEYSEVWSTMLREK